MSPGPAGRGPRAKYSLAPSRDSDGRVSLSGLFSASPTLTGSDQRSSARAARGALLQPRARAAGRVLAGRHEARVDVARDRRGAHDARRGRRARPSRHGCAWRSRGCPARASTRAPAPSSSPAATSPCCRSRSRTTSPRPSASSTRAPARSRAARSGSTPRRSTRSPPRPPCVLVTSNREDTTYELDAADLRVVALRPVGGVAEALAPDGRTLALAGSRGACGCSKSTARGSGHSRRRRTTRCG